MYKKYRRGANVADGIDTALSVTSVGLAASGVGLLSTIIAAPVAIAFMPERLCVGCWGPAGNWSARGFEQKPGNMI